MNPSTMSHDECYRLARTHMAQQDWATAAKLLQAAILKAPSEPLYLQTLDDLRAQRMREMRQSAHPQGPPSWLKPPTAAATGSGRAEIDALREVARRYPDEPEHLLRLACQLDVEGQTQEALQAARQALGLSEGLLDAHLLVLALHKKLGNRSAQAQARAAVQLVSGGALAEVRAARQRLKRLGFVDKPAIAVVPERGQWLRACLLVALLLVTAGGYLLGRPPAPVPVDASPFLAFEADATASERAAQGELLLDLQADSWASWSSGERRTRLLALYEVARDLGYRRLLVRDASGAMLGLAEPDKLYLRQQVGAKGGKKMKRVELEPEVAPEPEPAIDSAMTEGSAP